MTLFPESCVKKRKWRSKIYNYKQLYKNPCVSSTKVKQTMKGSLCYSESIYVHFKLSESILQDSLHASTLRKHVYNYTVTWKIVRHWLLAPSIPLQSGLKHSPCSTEWIDVYYKHTCGNIIILWYRSFRMISMRDKIHAHWKRPTL